MCRNVLKMEDSCQSSNQNSPVLCRSIDVWERRGDSVVRFRCFELLGASKYWVQSSDFYRTDDRESSREWLDRDFIEVFLETSLEDVDLFDSLEEAVSRHRAEFFVHLGE